MLRPVAAVTALAAMTAACTHHRDLRTLPDQAGKEVRVETHSGAELVAHVDVTPTVYGLRLPDGQIVAFQQVRKVVARNRGRGALEGLGIGILIGGGVGAISGFASGDDECDSDGGDWCILTFSAEQKAVLLGIVVGSIGGLVGLVAGSLRGSRDVYTFGDEQQFKVTPTGPPGSVAGATITF